MGLTRSTTRDDGTLRSDERGLYRHDHIRQVTQVTPVIGRLSRLELRAEGVIRNNRLRRFTTRVLGLSRRRDAGGRIARPMAAL